MAERDLVASTSPEPGTPARSQIQKAARLSPLDGWRAISILLVLATHLLPLGPKSWRLNDASGPMGMALFFTLSGFLITKQLHERRQVLPFFVRRVLRIVPLAYVYIAFVMTLVGGTARQAIAHLFFFNNYDTDSVTSITTHFWSLCVEMHFYLAIGLLMAATRFRGFRALVPLWLLFTLIRVFFAPLGTIETHYIIDEILAGACLALVYLGELGERPREIIRAIPAAAPMILLALASHPVTGTLNAFRGLAASVLVGGTLLQEDGRLRAFLSSRPLRYLAQISYALYVVHPATRYGWLGSGPTLVKYAKRPLSFAISFAVAHASTFYFEDFFIRLAKRLTSEPAEGPGLRQAA